MGIINKTNYKILTFRHLCTVVLVGLVVINLSCSSTKCVPEGQYLLKGNSVVNMEAQDGKGFKASQLVPYMRQNPNSRWFSVLNIPLYIYNLSGSDSTKWSNRMLRRLGEAPVVYDSLEMRKTCLEMQNAMHSFGYFDASVTSETKNKGRKCVVEYKVWPGRKYKIDSVRYDIEDDSIRVLLDERMHRRRGLKRGMDFSSANLDAERKRISQTLNDLGYYKFNKDFIHYEADSTVAWTWCCT